MSSPKQKDSQRKAYSRSRSRSKKKSESRSRSKNKEQKKQNVLELTKNEKEHLENLEKEDEKIPESEKEPPFVLPECFQRSLPNDILKIKESHNTVYPLKLKISDQKPTINTDYGDNKELIMEKNKITDVRNAWDARVKYLISEYELIDIFRPEGKAKYNQSIVRYMDYRKAKNGYLSSEHDGLSEVFSRAYFKLKEVLDISHALEGYKGKYIKVACLAEGPGGFINCLVDYRNKQNEDKTNESKKKYGLKYCYWTFDKYHSITLKINKNSMYNRALDWDHYKSKNYFYSLKKHKFGVNLSYGQGDGNMLDTDNLRYFIEKDLKNEKCELVTADGGIELYTDEEFEYQELYNVKLFFAEVITAMACQKDGGTYIMKIYDSFFDVTIEILILLTLYYEKVSITKPHTSRPASSERYLVCEGFKGISKEMIKNLMDLLDEWVKTEKNIDYLKNDKFVVGFLDLEKNKDSLFQKNLKESNEDCIHSQIRKIKEGLKIIEENKQEDVLERKKLQKKKAIAWCEAHQIPCLENLKLV